MKPRTTNIRDKAAEAKVKAWKLLLSKGIGEGEISALKAIIELAEPETEEGITNDR